MWNSFDDASVGSALFLGHAGTGVTRESTHVQLVNHGLGKWPMQRGIALPIEVARAGDHALHGGGRVVAGLPGGLALVVGRYNAFGVGIQQNFVGIVAISCRRIGRALNAIGVDLASFQFGEEDVPIVSGAVPFWVEVNHCGRLGVVGSVKQEQLHACPVLAIQAEIHAIRSGRCTQWKTLAGPELINVHGISPSVRPLSREEQVDDQRACVNNN